MKFRHDRLFKKWEKEKADRKRISEEARHRLNVRGNPIFRKYGIHKAFLFGSVLDGRAGDYSDTDLLVMPLSAQKYWDFRYELEQALSMPVDLFSQDDAPELVNKIMSRGELIYEIQS